MLKNQTKIPEGLTASIIESWLQGNTARTKTQYLDYVLELWQSLPDNRAEAYITIPEDTYFALRRERKRSGVNVPELLRSADDLPRGLTLSIAQGILSGGKTRARPSHMNYLLDRYRALPDSSRITLSDDVVQSLRREKKRTGVSIEQLIKLEPSLLRGIKPGLVYDWLAGTPATIDQDKLERVLQAWAALPDDEAR